jgi:hypothetical protein
MRGGGLVIGAAIIAVAIIAWIIYSSAAGAAPIATATLTSANGSGISGVARFIPTSDGQSTSVVVQLSGLQPDWVYATTIQHGNCLGPRLFILNGVTGNASGEGSSTTTVPAPPASTWYVVIHASASPIAPVVACGQVHVTGAQGGYVPPTSQTQPANRIPVENQLPYQLPNGGGGPPRTPLPGAPQP